MQTLHAHHCEHVGTPFPEPQRLIQGWVALPVPGPKETASTVIHWPGGTALPEASDYRLRLTSAVDVREIIRVQLESATTGQALGEMDFRYTYPLQLYELRLSREIAQRILREGLSLRRIEGEKPFSLMWRAPGDEANALCPHLLASDGRPGGLDEVLDRLCSLDALQPFGWLEGCVLDGLLEWQRARPEDPRFPAAIAQHFAAFTGPDGELVYENPRGLPSDGKVYGHEGPLPFAILAQTDPGHPWLQTASSYLMVDDYAYLFGDCATTRRVAETSYTCAYTLAALPAEERNQLAACAVTHLHAQRQALFSADEEALYLRRTGDGSRFEHRHWARAYSWYLLGLARSLPLLADLTDSGLSSLRDSFTEVSALALRRQLPSGLWSVYLDEPNLAPDTSGSAGIAAALALGVEHGLLSSSFLEPARRAYHALGAYLTPDGFLTGVSQSNKAGEALQRSDYRVIAQFGLGLYALLAASLEQQSVI